MFCANVYDTWLIRSHNVWQFLGRVRDANRHRLASLQLPIVEISSPIILYMTVQRPTVIEWIQIDARAFLDDQSLVISCGRGRIQRFRCLLFLRLEGWWKKMVNSTKQKDSHLPVSLELREAIPTCRIWPCAESRRSRCFSFRTLSRRCTRLAVRAGTGRFF